MTHIAAWTRFRGFLKTRRAELRLCFRVTVSALLAFLLASSLRVPLVLWPVLTAVIVTQLNVGKSLKAIIDYFIGTLGGALYAGVISALIPHTSEAGLLLVLALAIAPLALLAALHASFSVAPFTGVIVVLVPLITHVNPFESAFYRVYEVALGGGVALIVTLLVFPGRAHHFAIDAAAQMLDLIAEALPKLIAGFGEKRDFVHLHAIQDGLGKALTQLNMIAAEARQERLTPFRAEHDLDPLLRTLLRIRHDLIMIGRSIAVPLPDRIKDRLAPPLAGVAKSAGQFLHDGSSALRARKTAPSLEAFEWAHQVFEAEIAELRAEGLIRDLASESVEGIFALGFSLEQLHQNFKDLQQRVTDSARLPK